MRQIICLTLLGSFICQTSLANYRRVFSDPLQKTILKIGSFHQKEGNAFFISPNQIVTSFHALSQLSKNVRYIGDITLLRGEKELEVEQIEKVSALHNLAILRVKKPFSSEKENKSSSSLLDKVLTVKSWLELEDKQPISKEPLFVSGYFPGEGFKNIKKTGPIHETENSYFFPISHLHLFKGGGSPVVNEKGKVVGVFSVSGIHSANVIKVEFLKKLIKKRKKPFSPEIQDYVLEEAEKLKKMADKGSFLATYALAFMYLQGSGVVKDDMKAFQLFRKIAGQGHVLSQYQLIFMLSEGSGVRLGISEQEFLYWHNKFARQGNFLSQHVLGIMYLKQSRGNIKVVQKAIYWLQRASDQGFAPSQYFLAHAYRIAGNGKKFLEWLRKSADNNFSYAQGNLATLYHDGKLVRKNYNESIYWYDRLGNADKVFALSILNSIGRITIE